MRIWDIHPTDRTAIDPAGREAPRDPMRQQPRIPAGATSIAPPETGEHQAARWTGEAWVVVPDWRGHVYWLADGSRHEITELGKEPPADALDVEPPEKVDTLAARKRVDIDAASVAALDQVRSDYPDYEQLSWERQEREARDGAGPLIQAIADARGLSLEELIERIIAKADAYQQAAGIVIGRRQALRDQIDATEADEDLDDDAKRAAIAAITW
ncbi:hypothetical protein [Billgrantia ethanolica]|uniref:Uncharacterized protein n=1 Tax=Billgrantia ethanolica TaxID=2733486 RepID=A0ABS9A128_9GAMM|nr:hypothetical protein [Halomonas ethanolica]MCE8002538.1 hypothetical protein [Halomonas ethanolica]